MDGSHVSVELGLGYYKPQRYEKNLHFNLHQDISQMHAGQSFLHLESNYYYLMAYGKKQGGREVIVSHPFTAVTDFLSSNNTVTMSGHLKSLPGICYEQSVAQKAAR